MSSNKIYQLIQEARKNLDGIAKLTPLQYNQRLSEKYSAKVYLKREDLQDIRSFKIRGAYNVISNLNQNQKANGVVCASAGNHAQGVAYSCKTLKIKGAIFMPVNTPKQKIDRVKHFGGQYINIQLKGGDYHEAGEIAKKYCQQKKAHFVHPFDDPLTIAGQGTIGLEILEQLGEQNQTPDYILIGVGGGGLLTGAAVAIKTQHPKVKVISVEGNTQAGMKVALEKGKPYELEDISTFIDGTAVKKVGQYTFDLAKEIVDDYKLVSEGRVCKDMIELYQSEGIIVEPSGALSVSGLEKIKAEIKNKNVVCVICGGNNDISRYPEVIEKSLIWQSLKHYFIIEFNQKPGELRIFLDKVLGPSDDIVLFEYIKKTNKEKGPALVGIELTKKDDYKPLIERMKINQINFREVKSEDIIYQLLV